MTYVIYPEKGCSRTRRKPPTELHTISRHRGTQFKFFTAAKIKNLIPTVFFEIGF
jgi:hypothetical protein